jgi:N-acetylmuramoyl-L-alanine amidase
VKFANAHNADLFISIHVNSLPDKDRAVVETFYFGLSASQNTLRLVQAENRDSAYSVGDFHKMIRKIDNNFKNRESLTLAALIQKNLYRNIKRLNPKMVDAGIHTAPFVVLLGGHMPSVLAEISCISNPREEKRLATPAYRNHIAKYLERGIVAYLHRRRPEFKTTKGAKQYAGEKINPTG